MPESTSPVSETPVKTDVDKALDPQTKQEIRDATAPLWKKVLIWAAGILAALLAFFAGVTGILYVLKGQGPVSGVKEAVNNSKQQLADADMAEKIKIAEAKQIEQAVIDRLNEIKEIDDEMQRLEELNKLL